jgi:hypothetical protein
MKRLHGFTALALVLCLITGSSVIEFTSVYSSRITQDLSKNRGDPYTPSNPTPGNGSTNISLPTNLTWTGGDPDSNHTVTYDVYLGLDPNPPLVASDLTTTLYTPAILEYSTHYYWQIVARDNTNATTTGPLWDFITMDPPNLPPYPPNTPNPQNESIDISPNPTLSWSGGDPDLNDTVMYDVYFGTTPVPQKAASNLTSPSYIPGQLTYSTNYFWMIVAWDNHNASTPGPVWSFTTNAQPNLPPFTPNTPSPADGSQGNPLMLTLSWMGGDPDVNDTVSYDVYFGTQLPLSVVANNVTNASYTPEPLAYSTIYFWQAVAWDNHGNITAGPTWSFTTMAEPDLPPFVPSSPSPSDGATNVPVSVNLSWVGGDPDVNDTVSYDVYFGTAVDAPLVAVNITESSFPPGILTYTPPIIGGSSRGITMVRPLPEMCGPFRHRFPRTYRPLYPSLVAPTREA